jgi:hypothetical protein
MTDYNQLLNEPLEAPVQGNDNASAFDYNQLLNEPIKDSNQASGQDMVNLAKEALPYFSNPISESAAMAPAGQQAIASLPTSNREKIEYFAKQRFPKDPAAISRYGVKDGRIFYRGDDDRFYFEEPSFMQPVKKAASLVGESLPFAGGVGGAIAGGVAGGVGAVGGSAAGASLGDLARQMIAKKLGLQEQYSPSQTATEAVLGLGGEVIGRAGVGLFNRLAARDLERINTPAAKEEISNLQNLSEQTGVQLTPAELTNLRSLSIQQNALADLDRSSYPIVGLYRERAQKQIPAAVENVLGSISPEASKYVGADLLREGATGAMQREIDLRTEAAKPLYEKIRNVVLPESAVTELKADHNINRAMAEVARDPKFQQDLRGLLPIQPKELNSADKYLSGLYSDVQGATPSTNHTIAYLDAVKQQLDFKIDKAGNMKNKNAKRILTESSNKLKNIIDQIEPGYREAREAYRAASPKVVATQTGEIGLAAKTKDESLLRIGDIMFDTNPQNIIKNKKTFQDAGRSDEWNAGLRSFLANQFEAASKEAASGENFNVGGKFRSSVFGTDTQKEAMKAAMSPEQWRGFNDLMTVLEASARVPIGGSRTIPTGEAVSQMKREAAPIANFALNPATAVQRTYLDLKMGKYSEELADIITSPEGMKKLKQLRQWSPRSKKAFEIVSQLFTRAGAGAAGTLAESDKEVGSFSNEQ